MIGRIKFLLLFLMFTIPVTLLAQTGKVVGKVTDLETGEPLIGANILLEGTSLGGATDERGDFIILNVPPRSYTIKARYIGYREQTKTNVSVSVGLTTEINFNLPTEEYTTDVVVVAATRPLVDKNITNSTSVVRSEDIENLPVRGVNAIAATTAGVVSGRGGLNIRGSRQDGVAYYLDGVLVTNPVFSGAQIQSITNAVEEIQIQAGGYSSEYGGANGGIITTSTRTGSEKYRIGFEAITDNFAGQGTKYLGTYSTQYSEIVFTAGGPVIPSYNKLRFFVAGSNVFRRNGAAFRRGFNFQDIYDPGLGASADTFDYYYPEGYVVNSPSNTYQVQGNLTLDLNPVSIKVNGSFNRNNNRGGVGAGTLLAERSAALRQNQTATGSLKLTHVLSPNSFYDVIVNYFGSYNVGMDPFFKHDFKFNGDSIQNANVAGRTLRGDSQHLLALRGLGVAVSPADRPLSGYNKQRTEMFGGKVNFLYQLGKNHEFKMGGEFTQYTIRIYQPGSTFNLASNQKAIADGAATDVYARTNNYGYDVYGNESNNGLTDAKRPVFAAFYIQDKMEFSDLVLNVGFRFDYMDIDTERFDDPSNVKFDASGEIDQDFLIKVDPVLQVSPRIGFSFPVTDKTVFHAQYGKFVQMTRLRDSYMGYNLIADNIKGGFAIGAPVGFGLGPERTTSYEIGFRQQLGDFFAFDVTGFYKDIKDQIQIRSIFADPTAAHRQYYAYVNGDFATTKGVELKLDLRRTNRIAMTFDYTFSNALGTGSNSSTSFRTIWQSPTGTPYFPQQIAPLDFNQGHRGFMNIDYRFGANDGGPVLERMGLNLLFSFNSGFNYTLIEGYGNNRTPLEPINASTTPWAFQLDLRLDKSFDIGPLGMNIYLWVINVLNTQSITNVFANSGDAYDDGYLSSEEGRAIADGYYINYGAEFGQLYEELYRARSYSAGNFSTPRQIRLGLRINY